MIENSFELLLILYKLGYDRAVDEWWWPNSGSVDVIVGAILTQNTKWDRVEESLANLAKRDLLTLQSLCSVDDDILIESIKPSGFYKNKSKNIKLLANNILKDFGDFDTFKYSVDREWLLSQRGIGKESADSILCYCCYKEAFVVDSYTSRLLNAFGYEFDSYDTLQEFMVSGVADRYHQILPLPKAQAYARFHGMIVEYVKEHKKRGKVVDVTQIKL